MNLSQLAKKPQLVQITIADEDIVAEFGEAIDFWTWDRQPMDIFLKLASVDQTNTGSVIETVRQLVLDEKGRPVITGENTLPTRVMMRVITAVIESLGK